MKEFLKTNTVTYNLMSFTGFKALIVFSLLMESPKSYEEVCEYFLNHPYIQEKISIDTFRVYITSLKMAGCQVKRERINKVSKYSIISHPFELSITDEQTNSLLKIYKNMSKSITIQELILFEEFIEKIAQYIKDEKFINAYKKVSVFKDINIKLIKELLECCDKKEQIVIKYNSPNSGKKNIEIISDKLEFSNNKLYLYGTGFEYMQYGSFLVSRIDEIVEIKEIKTIPLVKELKVGYSLTTNPKNVQLRENEKIIQTNKDNIIIEITSSNEFLTRQRLLEYGPECTILYPESFKKDFVTYLESMKAGYFND